MSFSSDADRERPLILKGRVDWKQVAGAVGLKSQQCQRRIKALSADLPRLRVLYRMTSRATVNMMTASRPALRSYIHTIVCVCVCVCVFVCVRVFVCACVYVYIIYV